MITTELAQQLKRPELIGLGSFIGGEWRIQLNRFPVLNPANGETLAEVPAADKATAREAIECAEYSLYSWAQSGLRLRQKCLKDWADLIREHREDLARLITLEEGKPLSEAQGEVNYGLSFLDYYADLEQIEPVQQHSHLAGAVQEIRRQPLGVVALITPWNFPLAMLTRKAGAALLAGCTCIATPSPETPLTALYLTRLAELAQIPKGVLNLVIGDPETIVTPWIEDSRVRGLSFTGSTQIGQKLYQQSAQTIRRLMLELGGHAPAIVFPSADLVSAVDHIIAAKFATSGEDCLAINRLYVHDSVYEEIVDMLHQRIVAMRLGAGMNDPDIGPMIHPRAVAKLHAQVEDALTHGARLVCGGAPSDLGSCFYLPTLLSEVSDEMLISREETFGPVLSVMRFDEENEVTRRANNSDYGLIAYLYSQDKGQIERVSSELEYGMIAVNRSQVTGAPIPFGGVKQSGLNREGGPWGYEAFTEIKYICKQEVIHDQ